MKNPLLRLLILAAVMAAIPLLTVPVAAAGLNLGWSSSTAVNDCPSSPASSLYRSSACTSNAGASMLIGSVVAPPGLVKVVGQSVIIMYQETADPLSDWWNFDLAGCRGNPSALSLGMSFDPLRNDGICGNLWKQDAVSAFSYQANTDQGGNPRPGMAKVTMVGAVPLNLGAPWPAGTEWYSFILSIENTHTAAPQTVCNGCQNQVCFFFTYANVVNDATAGGTDAFLTGPPAAGGSNLAVWQQAPPPGVAWCFGVVPTKRATWGQVKSLYR